MKTFMKIMFLLSLVAAIFVAMREFDIPTRVLAASNVFIPSSSLFEQDYASLEESLSAPYLQSANFNKVFDEFSEQTISSDGFYLRIDRINLFKAVVKDVDPREKEQYVKSWEKGISHGMFTSTPDKIGMTYLYSHAVSNDNRALDENAWFTHMDEVQLGDEVVVYYDGMKYTYQVSDIKVVSPDATGFYTGVAPVATLRMQFCAPPQGSLERRTLVDALLISAEPFYR